MKKTKILSDIKEEVAKRWGKASWAVIKREYEYGMGISKLISFEELMNSVAERYKKSK